MTSSPTPLRLYTTSTAPNPRRVHMFLAEKGVEIPRIEIDITTLEHKRPEYLERTGMPVVPALELSDGTVLTESVAICRYVEALHPEPPLFGTTPLESALVEMWQRRAELYVLLPIAQVFRHSNPHMARMETQVPEWAEANRPRVQAGMALLDRRLREAPFLAGERLSMADITATVALDFMRVIRTPIPDECDALAGWFGAMRERPSVIWRR